MWRWKVPRVKHKGPTYFHVAICGRSIEIAQNTNLLSNQKKKTLEKQNNLLLFTAFFLNRWREEKQKNNLFLSWQPLLLLLLFLFHFLSLCAALTSLILERYSLLSFTFFFCWVFARNYKDCFFVLIKLVYGDPFLNCSEKRS